MPRSSLTDDEPRADDLSNYKVCRPGDIVINRMSAYQGALGRSDSTGIVSPDYIVLRPSADVHSRWLHYLMRSSWFVGQMTSRIRGIGSIGTANVRTPRVSAEEIGDIEILLPDLATQRAIADHLDAETARIDALIAKKQRLIELVDRRTIALVHAMLTGQGLPGQRHRAIDWLGSTPEDWPIASVSSQFEVVLGRMLNQERAAATDQRPYVRNINVRWDHVDVTDLASMHFTADDRKRLRLHQGDLLVNEGGAGIGRTAVWRGEVEECYFQKSVLRLRPSGWTHPAWFMECMRLAVHQKVFLVEGNLATIPHVPAEALRAHRFPFPPSDVQRMLLARLDQQRSTHEALRTRIDRQVALLREHRQALITAAVTGELAVPGAN